MKKLVFLVFMSFCVSALNAQKIEPIQKEKSKTLVNQTLQILEWAWSPLLGVDVVHFGQTTTYYTLPKPGHTYQFSALHGLVVSYTATTVSILWNVAPYSWGCARMIETNENGDVRYTSHPVIIIP